MIALIDYGAGNTASVANVLKELNVNFVITDREENICRANKIIFPGVGEASSAVRRLHLSNLFTQLRIIKKPLLGICLGMQLLCNKSEEGNTTCLGVLPIDVKRFSDKSVKVPHMGWNKTIIKNSSPLFSGLNKEEYFYFANSYYVPVNDYTSAECKHGIKFSAAIEKNNFYGVQFHPEKSGPSGIKLIKNFIEKC